MTDAERKRFATWLEQDAASNAAIAKQAEKLGPAGILIAKMNRQEAMAEMIVARRLRNTESLTLGEAAAAKQGGDDDDTKDERTDCEVSNDHGC